MKKNNEQFVFDWTMLLSLRTCLCKRTISLRTCAFSEFRNVGMLPKTLLHLFPLGLFNSSSLVVIFVLFFFFSLFRYCQHGINIFSFLSIQTNWINLRNIHILEEVHAVKMCMWYDSIYWKTEGDENDQMIKCDVQWLYEIYRYIIYRNV